MNFSRSELTEIKKRALEMKEVTPNEDWKRAYDDLAYACNVLDAHFGRSTTVEPN